MLANDSVTVAIEIPVWLTEDEIAEVILQDPDVATVASFIGTDGTNPTLSSGRFSIALKPLEAGRSYKVAGWAPVSEEARNAGGKPIWEVVEPWLKARGTVSARRPNLPVLVGMRGNPGAA